MKLSDLCGNHMLSGVELQTYTHRDEYTYEDETVNAVKFQVDGINYMAVEDPDDGYRSYCSDLEVVDTPPKNVFEAIPVEGYMLPDSNELTNNVLCFKSVENGLDVLAIGTQNTSDWYTWCLFQYTPENLPMNHKESEVIELRSNCSCQIGMECKICGKGFEVTSDRETWRICPECTQRLKILLYPDDTSICER